MTHIAAPLLPLDADPRSSTGRTLGWGVISTGRIADKVTPDIALLEDAKLVAVSSRSQSAADEFAAKHGFLRGWGDDDDATGMERLLADEDIDVVYVATPHGQHFEHARAALEAGKHVVCEKALTITAAEAQGLVDLAQQKGLFLMEGLWTRFQPGVQQIMGLLDNGVIGTPRWVQSDLGFAAPKDPEHRIWRKDAGGGALLDLGVYVLHWAWASMGFPEAVEATAVLTEDGVDELTSMTGRFPGGGLAQMQMTLVSSAPSRAVISGTAGHLVIEGPLHRPLRAWIHRAADAKESGVAGAEPEKLEFSVVGQGYVYEMREAASRIQRGETESPVMPWADSIRQMELFDALREQMGVRYPNDC